MQGSNSGSESSSDLEIVSHRVQSAKSQRANGATGLDFVDLDEEAVDPIPSAPVADHINVTNKVTSGIIRRLGSQNDQRNEALSQRENLAKLQNLRATLEMKVSQLRDALDKAAHVEKECREMVQTSQPQVTDIQVKDFLRSSSKSISKTCVYRPGDSMAVANNGFTYERALLDSDFLSSGVSSNLRKSAIYSLLDQVSYFTGGRNQTTQVIKN